MGGGFALPNSLLNLPQIHWDLRWKYWGGPDLSSESLEGIRSEQSPPELVFLLLFHNVRPDPKTKA
jgi:hypothetical protein